MPNLQLIQAFLEHATAKGSRSTALKPLGWILALLMPATLASFWPGIPIWVGITFAVLTVTAVVSYIVCYVFLLLTDKDALRSETFTIQKLAIEKGVYGDSLTGTLDTIEVGDRKLISERTSGDEESSE